MQHATKHSFNDPQTKAELDRTFAFISKRQVLSPAEYVDWYEQAAQHYLDEGAEAFLKRYGRNYVVKAHGEAPDFDSISEYGHLPGRQPTAPGPLDSIGIARTMFVNVLQRIVAGPPLRDDKGPVHKRALLLKRAWSYSPKTATATISVSQETFRAEAAKFADDLAQQLADSVQRVVLYTAITDTRNYPTIFWPGEHLVEPAMDAMIMLWPAPGAALPDSHDAPPAVRIRTVLDLKSYYSQIAA